MMKNGEGDGSIFLDVLVEDRRQRGSRTVSRFVGRRVTVEHLIHSRGAGVEIALQASW